MAYTKVTFAQSHCVQAYLHCHEPPQDANEPAFFDHSLWDGYVAGLIQSHRHVGDMHVDLFHAAKTAKKEVEPAKHKPRSPVVQGRLNPTALANSLAYEKDVEKMARDCGEIDQKVKAWKAPDSVETALKSDYYECCVLWRSLIM